MFKESASLIKKRSYQYFYWELKKRGPLIRFCPRNVPFLSQCSHFKLSESTKELVFCVFRGCDLGDLVGNGLRIVFVAKLSKYKF